MLLHFISNTILKHLFIIILLKISPNIFNRAVTLEMTMFIVVLLQNIEEISPDQAKRNREAKDLNQG